MRRLHVAALRSELISLAASLGANPVTATMSA